MKDLFIVVNVDKFLLSHRLPIALAAMNKYRVTIVSRDTGFRREIESYGLNFIDVPFERSGTNIFHELKCVFKLRNIYRRSADPVIHHVTIKASVLGSVAARFARKKKVVNAISGFGYGFTGDKKNFKQKLVRLAFIFGLKNRHNRFIFQNEDDIREFRSLGFKSEAFLIRGSGIDLGKFGYTKEVEKNKIRVVFAGRLLYDKGIIEFIRAAKAIKEDVANKAEFIIAGNCDMINPAGIKEEDILEMLDEPYIKWIGYIDNIYDFLKESDIVVLPSYREGLPKFLIEACAVGRPIVTTDAPGCKECVVEGVNGYMVPVRDTELLSLRIKELIEDQAKRELFGRKSRQHAEKYFSIEDVVKSHLEIYESMC
ncbi:MAG: glycosyltransferase family 4 protein [Rikenellaceae bacterium]|nr:glycosyltransferase family 4 protein [Rikenellaceae bacterium]